MWRSNERYSFKNKTNKYSFKNRGIVLKIK